jgi:dTDP-4-amino-4,6-dideoxygalactose transaminase
MAALSWDKFHGHLSSYDIETLGYNYRTTEIQSALGLVQLKKLDRNNKKRKELILAYQKELRGAEGISIPFLQFRGQPSYHLIPVLVDSSVDRNRVMGGLKKFGIQTSVHYPPVHLFSLYLRQFRYKKGMLPRTEEVSQREITLPLHPRMDGKDVKWIAKKVKRIVKLTLR